MSNQWLDLNRGQFSLSRLPEVWRCKTAIWLLLATAGVVVVLMAMAFALIANGHWQLPLLLYPLIWLAAVTGLNAAGIALTNFVHGREGQGFVDYLLAGLFCIPRLIGAAIVLFLGVLAVALGAALVLFVCKLPGLGPLLLVVVVPVLIYVFAALLLGMYLASVIVLPALWAGEGVFSSLTAVYRIVRQFPLQSAVKVFLGSLLASFFASMVGGLVAVSTMMVLALAVPTVGSRLGSLTDINPAALGGGAGEMIGGMVGLGLAYAVVATVVTLLFMMVGVLTWAEFSARIDLDALREEVKDKVNATRERVEQTRTRVMENTRRGPASASAAGAAPRADGDSPSAAIDDAPATAHTCPQCAEPVAAADLFCGHCGHRLKQG